MSKVSQSRVQVYDPSTGLIGAVETVGGKPRFLTDTNISSVNVPNGRDPFPDTFFPITQAGGIGDTVRIQIAAVTDPTGTERNLPAVDVTTTLTATEAGDEKALAELIVSDLEADANFVAALLEAEVITDKDRAIVHITSTIRALPGEFGERATVGDFSVTPTGTTVITLDSANQTIVSRAKENSLGRDPANPHRLGVVAISGQVIVRAGNIDKLYQARAENAGSDDLAVDGSGTPVVFSINANAAGGNPAPCR